MFNKAISTAKANPLGFVAGAGLTFWGIGKYTTNKKMWVTILGSLVGGYVGAYAWSNLMAKKGEIKSTGSIPTLPVTAIKK
jgi:hypothetical protein